MDGINKKLAYGLWAVSGISALISVINCISLKDYFSLIFVVITIAFQVLLGYTILRDKNDKFTMVSVILIAIFTFNLAGVVAIIIRLILRKDAFEKQRKYWFVPAIVSGVFPLISLFKTFTFLGVVSLVLIVSYYLIFGYWFIKYLKIN